MIDLILHGGRIYTVDAAWRIAEAVAIKGDSIVAVGSSADIRPLAGPSTRRIDLRGRAVIPGLIDGHAHMDREGLRTIYPSLQGAQSIDDILQRIEALVKGAAPGEWIMTMPIGEPPSYHDVPNNLREKRFPTRWELDRVSPNNPVYIRSIWGYWRMTLPLASVANSAALRAAGITRDTVAPCPAVEIDKDPATGEPTGIFYESALAPLVELTLMAAAPRFTHADRVAALKSSMRTYNATGTTSIFEGHGIAAEVLGAYRHWAERDELTVRSHLVLSPSWSSIGAVSPRAFLHSWGSWFGGRGGRDGFLRTAGMYVEVDESAERTVRAQAAPYSGWAGFSPDAGLPRGAVKDLIVEAARNDIRVVCIARHLLDFYLDAYEEANRAASIVDKRWVIAHITTLAGDQIRRIRDLGIVLTALPNLYIGEGSKLLRQGGAGVEDTIVPLVTLKEAGVRCALATDNVPPSMFVPLWHCVARRDRLTNAVIAPGQRLSREEALRAATLDGAYLTFEEDRKGSIEPGKLADLVVLSEDVLAIDEHRIKDVVADVTIVGGRVVYARTSSEMPESA